MGDGLGTPVVFFESELLEESCGGSSGFVVGAPLGTTVGFSETGYCGKKFSFVVGMILVPPWASLKVDLVEGFSGFVVGGYLVTPVGIFEKGCCARLFRFRCGG